MTESIAAATAAAKAKADVSGTRDTLLSLLEVHTEGATVSELASYTERERSGVLLHLKAMEKQGKVHTTSADRNTKLWHLTPQQAEVRSLTPVRPLSLPLPSLRSGRSR